MKSLKEGELLIKGKPVNPTSLKWFAARKVPVEVKVARIDKPFEVGTLEGTHHGNAGDYLIQGIKGELYPIKPDIFEKTYQPNKEWTKGVSIPCRDCGEVLSILTTESAKILDARCPKCHKEFQKKGEEFNLEIGYTRQGEALSPLALSSLADNGSFGLEKWLLGIKDEKAKELLRDGIAFCDYIINRESGVSYNTAKNARSRIKTLIAEDVAVSEQEVRAMQAFFDSESAPMLRGILAQQLSEERKKKETTP